MRVTLEHETRTIVDGVEYHAQTKPDGTCEGCAFFDEVSAPPCLSAAAVRVTPCLQHDRADRTAIIWVRA